MSKLTIRHPITFIIFLCDIYILFTMLKQLTDKIIKHKKLNVKLFFKKIFIFFKKFIFYCFTIRLSIFTWSIRIYLFFNYKT